MRRPRSKSSQKGAIELIEEAVHLLRQAHFSTLAAYYIGSLPFVIGVLYFWAEMSRSPFAYQHLAAESLGLAALFLWMKIWQVRFARALWAQISGRELTPFTVRQWANVVISQSALQVSGLVVLPAALVLTIPFGWVYAFYQNATVTADPDKGGLRQAFSKARKHALLWPRQNHVMLSILGGFGIFVLVNWVTVCLALPALAKTIFGFETVLTRSTAAMLNTTFFATVCALTYLAVDPLVKAVYTVRCFYGEALHSGEDIKAELRQVAASAPAFGAAMLLMLVAGSQFLTMSHFACFSAVPSGLAARSMAVPRLESLGYFRKSLRDYPKNEMHARTTGLVLAATLNGTQRDITRDGTCGLNPEGMIENSPGFQPWDRLRNEPSPEGTAEGRHLSTLASDLSHVPPIYTKLTHWAIIIAPFGRTNVLLCEIYSSVVASTFGRTEIWPLAQHRNPLSGLAAAEASPSRESPLAAVDDGPTGPARSTPSLPPSQLDDKIQQVLKEDKYTWRFPRDTVKQPEKEKGPIGRFLESIGDTLHRWGVSVRDWAAKILRRLFETRSPSQSSSGSGWVVSVHLLLYLLIAAVIVCVAILLYRLFTKRSAKQTPITSEAIPSAPNLLDENVGAEQLPEDSWTTLGRELLQRGELRLALRAFYLASLAHLASRNLISLARFKSNRDYYRELERRGHSFPQVVILFADNVSVFDRIWYGMHEITPDLVNQFLSKVERIKAGGTAPT